MADTTLMDTRWTAVETFSAFPESASVYVISKTREGGTQSCSIMDLNDMQAVLDAAIKNGWQRS